ncbi:hypothetical protein [Siminovitchia sp. FSL W7-1587]
MKQSKRHYVKSLCNAAVIITSNEYAPLVDKCKNIHETIDLHILQV